MVRRPGQGAAPTTPHDRHGGFRALSVRQIGPALDEDVWDRVVALWRDPAAEGARRPEPAAAQALRDAVRNGTTVLLLVTDGPRLLGFAAVDADRRGLRELQVRARVPEGVVLRLLLESALAAAHVEAIDARPAPAAA